MTSRRMVWKRRRTSQARVYFCRIRALSSATIYNNTDSNVWLCDQVQKIIMKWQTMWLCLSVALAGNPSSYEGLYGDCSPQDELVNPPYQIATTVSLNHHRGPGLLQRQSGHSPSAAETFLMFSNLMKTHKTSSCILYVPFFNCLLNVFGCITSSIFCMLMHFKMTNLLYTCIKCNFWSVNEPGFLLLTKIITIETFFVELQ